MIFHINILLLVLATTESSTLLTKYFCWQEKLIRSILAKPFKIPMKNYNGSGYQRSLGIRRSGVRRALHDPEAPGALVLFSPPELSQHEKITSDMWDLVIQAHDNSWIVYF